MALEDLGGRAAGELRAGDLVGRFEVECLLGKGSTGAVYRARDPVIDRYVALKTLCDDRTRSPEDGRLMRRRFLNEARSAGAIDHPGIVTVYDVVEDAQGRVAIAMEYVEGQSLREVLDDPSPLPLRWIGRTVTAIAEILDEAHRRGIVHRDIKPANILLATDGHVKVADFGIASLRGDDLASDLNSLGTPNFLAPERILGRPADHRADVYALGVVLYEMLTRRLPFKGETIGELARNIIEEPFGDPLTLRPDLPLSLVNILGRALEKEPEVRYQSAGRLAADLDDALARQERLSDTVPSPSVEELDLVEPGSAGSAGGGPPSESLRHGAEGAQEAAGKILADEQSAVMVITPPEPVRRRRPLLRAAALSALAVLAALSVALAVESLRDRADAMAQAGIEEQRRLQVQALLAEGESLLGRGDIQLALRAIEQAEALSPAEPGLSALRAKAEERWRARLAAERRAEAQALYDEAQSAFESRDYDATELALSALFSVDAEHAGGRTLESAVSAIRTALSRPTVQAPLPDPEVEETVVDDTESEAPVFEAFESLPLLARADPMATLRVEFLSERPKGVLTLYSGEEQLLLRQFRFFERRGLIRRRAVAGAFEAESRVAAGATELRVYLSLPGRETQFLTVSGSLDAGTRHTLEVRVDESGTLSVNLR